MFHLYETERKKQSVKLSIFNEALVVIASIRNSHHIMQSIGICTFLNFRRLQSDLNFHRTLYLS